MKTLFKFFLSAVFSFSICFVAISQDKNSLQSNSGNNNDHAPTNPLYQLRVGNITSGISSNTGDNTIFFDIYILHTNPGTSGPFEFSAGQYYLKFNPSVANGGSLTYSIIPGSSQFTNPDAVPINPSIVGGQLRLERNIPILPGSGPIVSTVFPGTRVASLKLTTTAPTIDLMHVSLSWINSTLLNSGTEVYAFVNGVSTNLSDSGTYIIDSVDVPLPVELSGFTSSVNKNNVLLRWTTSSEQNNFGFDIERLSLQSGSSNNEWEKIGFLKGYGTSSSSISYSFTDKNLNSGVFKYRLKQTDINGNYEYFNLNNEVIIGAPDKFSLKQNYPNPFNPSTKIDFDIPNSGIVTLKIFDINGKEVKSLVNEFKNSGYYSIDFNASALPSGAYYYILNSGNFSSTKKLILLK